MTDYFLDSSALAKRYMKEIGTDWIRSITARNTGNIILVAQITRVEVLSSVMRRRREGTTTPRDAQAIQILMDRHMKREYRTLLLTAQVIERAESLITLYPLRAYDAIQLASALEGDKRLSMAGLDAVIFVSADKRLLMAASAAGLKTDDPNAHA